MARWAEEELNGINLGDRRRDKRAIALLDTLSARPTASIPGACSDWSETMAAYRFFGNDDITWEAILTPHWSCSRRRIAQHKVVLMLQDTTELDFNGQSIVGDWGHSVMRLNVACPCVPPLRGDPGSGAAGGP